MNDPGDYIPPLSPRPSHNALYPLGSALPASEALLHILTIYMNNIHKIQ